MLCLILLTSCGRNIEQDSMVERYYSVVEVPFPEPLFRTEKPVMMSEELDYLLSDGSLFKLDRVVYEEDYSTCWYLSTLSSPYDNWNTVLIDTSGIFDKIRTEGKEYYIVGGGGLTKQGYVYLNYGELDSDEISSVVCKDGEWLPLDYLTEESGDSLGYSASIEGLYRAEADELQELLKWETYGYHFYEDPMIYVESEDSILVLEKNINGNTLLRVQVKESVNAEKQQVLLAAYPSAYLNGIVNDFNKQSDCYEVVMMDCSRESALEIKERFGAEIMAGKGPDLIDSIYIDLYSYAKNGYLEPLDDLIKDKDILWQIAESGNVAGKCYIAPYYFSIQSLVSAKEVVGDRDGWSIDEMIKTMETHPAEALYLGADAYGVLSCLLYYDEENATFVDWDNNTCSFENQEFITLLECAKEWKDYQSNQASLYMGEEVRDGHVMVVRTVGGMGGKIKDYYSNLNMFGDSCIYVGYPVENGNGTFLEGWGFSVNRSSKCKDGAKAFLEYIMSEEVQLKKWEQDGTLPVNEKLLKKVVFEYAKDLAYEETLYSNEKRPYDEEEINNFYKLIQNSKPMGRRYAAIEDIIYEEAATYFEGNVDPHEVAGKIQNRVQLYLVEHS